MTTNMRVSCEVDRYWDIQKQEYVGRNTVQGTLLEFSTQTIKCEKTDIEKITPVGIVLLDDDDSLASVPVEFMKRFHED